MPANHSELLPNKPRIHNRQKEVKKEDFKPQKTVQIAHLINIFASCNQEVQHANGLVGCKCHRFAIAFCNHQLSLSFRNRCIIHMLNC
jgi:hypothetical protein